jgi:hypothetical protein
MKTEPSLQRDSDYGKTNATALMRAEDRKQMTKWLSSKGFVANSTEKVRKARVKSQLTRDLSGTPTKNPKHHVFRDLDKEKEMSDLFIVY